MADGSQTGTLQDDELDFRPAKAAVRPGVNASDDGLDFQPSTPAVRAPKAKAAAQDSGVDFQPAVKPAAKLRTPTLDELTTGIHPEAAESPWVTAKGASIGQPISFRPPFVDTTQIPRNVFTGGAQGPGMAAAHGTPYEGSAAIGERIIRAFGAGAPEDSKMAEWTGQRGTKENPRLFAPEQLMTETERQRHPVLTGAGEFAGGMTSPESLMLIGLTAGAGQLAGPGAAVAKRLLSAGFSIPMLINAARMTPEIADAFQRGDIATGERLLTHAVLSASTAGLAGRGMFEEAPPVTVQAGAIGSKIALDEALSRGGRRMQEFQANEGARRGMGNLAEAERGIEAARQARIGAPIEIPPTRGEPTILQGRRQGPERNPLEVEAQRVREERAARQEPEPIGFRVIDMRRVQPEGPATATAERPPYYEIAPQPGTEQKGLAIGAPIAARGRSKALGELGSRVLEGREKSLVPRFGPDVLGEARQELNAAAGLASSFERPGRYFAEYGGQEEHMPSRSTNAAKGIHAGGAWYGVSSARGMIEDMHPWFADVAEGPETFSRTVQEGKGAAYDRLLERAATHIQAERESARPIIEEFAPHLRDLAGQVRGVDPDLADSLASLAEGKGIGFRNLREYLEGRVHDAQAAALFSNAVDEAASEAGGPAGTESAPQLGGEARATEGRGREETAREPAGAIDFRKPLSLPATVKPGDFPLGSVESRARARVLAETTREIDVPPEMLDVHIGFVGGPFKSKTDCGCRSCQDKWRKLTPEQQSAALAEYNSFMERQWRDELVKQGQHAKVNPLSLFSTDGTFRTTEKQEKEETACANLLTERFLKPASETEETATDLRALGVDEETIQAILRARSKSRRKPS